MMATRWFCTVSLVCCLIGGLARSVSADADTDAAPAAAAPPAEAADPIRAEFDLQDADRDASITQQELYEYLRARIADDRVGDAQLNAMVAQTFGMVDANNDGAITFAEYQAKTKLRRRRTAIPGRDLRLFEGRFSQSSFNALASVLIHYYGPTPIFNDRDEFERRTFHEPLEAAGFADYFGWGPWTAYTASSGKLVWNRPITDLRSAGFTLKPTAPPTVDAEHRTITVKYAAGERARLEATLTEQLARGPVILWAAYAAEAVDDAERRWRHVTHADDSSDVVLFEPVTRSVTLYARGEGRIMVVDGSVPEGVYYTDTRTIVATAAAMTAFVRMPDDEDGPIIDRIAGVDDDRFNVVFWRQGGDGENGGPAPEPDALLPQTPPAPVDPK